MISKTINKTIEMPALNGRFGASGGVARPTLECRTATSALVQTAVESPACAKPLGRYTQAGGRQCRRTMKREN